MWSYRGNTSIGSNVVEGYSGVSASPAHWFDQLIFLLFSEGDGYGINELYTSEYYTKLGTLGKILIPNGLINDRVHRIADIIRKDYPGQTVHLLCILKGSISYFNDLMGWLRSVNSCCVVGNAPFTYDFIRVSSYNGMDSVGLENVKLEGGFGHLNNLKDRHVVVVEDLIGTYV